MRKCSSCEKRSVALSQKDKPYPLCSVCWADVLEARECLDNIIDDPEQDWEDAMESGDEWPFG